MASERQILETIEKISSEMNGFIAASVVDMESGLTLGAKSLRNDFDLAVASAYNSELVKQKTKIIKALNLKSTLEDMVLTLSDQIHLIKLITPNVFLYLAADKESTNLGIVRSVVNRYVAELR